MALSPRFRILAGILGGFYMALMAVAVLVTGMASAPGYGSLIVFVLVWAQSIRSACHASGTGQAWRRVLLSASYLSFLLAAVACYGMGAYIVRALLGKYTGPAIGEFIVGSIATVAGGAFGLVMGIVLLLVGLQVGKKGRA